jgi:hypothetical protein
LVRRGAAPGEPPTALAGTGPWVDRSHPADGPVLDLPHPNAEARSRFGRRPGIPVDAVVWLAPGEAVPSPVDGAYAESYRMTVTTHVGWRPSATEADPADVVKQVSLLAAAPGYSTERFREHYRHHVALARQHMPALWQYVQNDVEASTATTDAGRAIVAVSELWFATTDDFCHRYFPSPADQEAFSAQEGFLDLTKAISFVCASHTLAGAGR